MPILFTCPCGRYYRAEDSQAGQTFLCTVCSGPLTVPAPPDAAEADLPPSSVPRRKRENEDDPEAAEARPPSTGLPRKDEVGRMKDESSTAPSFFILHPSSFILCGVLLSFLLIVGLGTGGVFLAIFLANNAEQAGLPPPPDNPPGAGQERPKEGPPPVEPPVEPPRAAEEHPPAPPERPPAPPAPAPDTPAPPVRPPAPPDGVLSAPTALSDTPWMGHAGPVHALAFTRDGKLLWSGAGGTEKREGRLALTPDNSLRAWSALEGKEVRRLEGFPGGVGAAAFSPDGRLAAVASAARLREREVLAGGDTITLWDLETRKLLHTLEGHTREVFCLAFTPDGRKLLSGGADFTLRGWDVASGKSLFALPGHTNAINQVAVSPDGKTALTGSSDLSARLWDIDNGKFLRRLADHRDIVWTVAFSPNGKTALTAGGMQHIPGIGFTAGARDHDIRLWEVESGKELKRLSGHAEAVGAAVFSPDGRRVLSAGNDGKLFLWRVDTGKLVKQLPGHSSLVRAVAFFPDGRRAVSGGDDRRLRVWDLPLDVPDLVKDLRSADSAVRTNAILELGKLGAEGMTALPALLGILASGDPVFRSRVLLVVKGLGPIPREQRAKVEALLADPTFPEGREFALDTIDSWGAEARASLKPLLGLLGDREPLIRVKVVGILAKLGPDAHDDVFGPLAKALEDKDAKVRGAALAALEKVGASRADMPQLRKWLDSKTLEVRKFACKALTGLDAREAADDLLVLVVREDKPELRALALAGLARLAPARKQTTSACVRALGDEDSAVRLAAARALASLPAEADPLPALLEAMDHDDEEVRKVAAEAIGKARLDRSAVPVLAQLLGSKKEDVRGRVLEALGKLGDQSAEAVPAICKVLRSARADERKKVLATLNQMGPAAREAGPDLAKLLEDKTLRMSVIELLAKTQAPEIEQAVPSLIESLKDEKMEDLEDDDLKAEHEKTRKLLVQAGKHAVPGLIKALERTFDGGSVRTPEGILRAAARLEVVKVCAELDGKAKTNYLLVVLARVEKGDPAPGVRLAAREARGKLLRKE